MTPGSDVLLSSRFELLERIGGGAFGEVWRGRDKATRRGVAVKRLHAHLADAEAILRFAREAEMLARVDSDFVVGYVAHGRDAEGRPWLALDWLEGEVLSAARQHEGFTLADALEAVRDAALGAAALHAAGIVHRDLKPTNLITATRTDGARTTRIVDLGVAHLTDATVLTQAGTILGSPAYMAPEQVRGEAIDARADLWSLGVVLYELITGEAPFGSANAIAVLGKVLLEPAPALRARARGVPSEVEHLVNRLLEKEPERRLASARELADALTALRGHADLTDAMAARLGAPQDERSELSTTQLQNLGERRLVALLFARAGVDAAGDVDAAMAAAIERFGGRAEPLRGAWLGGFGLSRARGDEWLSAAHAAREMQRGGARVALVAGWAEVRSGSVMTGQLIERGAALLDRTAPGELRVPDDAAGMLVESFAFEPVAPGEQRLVREHGPRSQRMAGAPPALLGRVVAAVGRSKELRLLDGVFAECVEEHASRVALVVGEAGLGKSRVRYEVVARLQSAAEAPEALELRGEPMLSDVPHAMLVKGLREAAGLEEGHAPEVARARLRGFVEPWLQPEGADVEFLGELLRVPSGDRPGRELRTARQDPALLRQRVREALARLLRAMAEARPLLITVDDLQWADRATVDLLAWILDQLQDAAVTVLAFARPEVFERHPALWHGIPRTELRLAPLSLKASEQLIAAVLAVGDQDRREIAVRAGGNPLFLEELVRARAEGAHELPIAVHAALQVRLDALGQDARRLAQAASVFGQTFWTEGVAALRPALDVSAALEELVRAEVVLPRAASRFAQTRECAFGHALVRDAAYAMLVDGERRELHARAAAWLDRMGESDVAVIGQHYEAGHRPAEAAERYSRAAEAALRASAYEAAEMYATRSAECAPTGRLAAATLLLRAEARRALGRSHAMLDDARAAVALVEHDAALAIEARSRVAQAQRIVGELADADATLRGVLEESHASLLAARVAALVELALVDVESGRGSEAVGLIDEALSWLDGAGPEFEHQRLAARGIRVDALLATGEPGAALTAAQGALADASASGHRAQAAEARARLGWVLRALGRAEDAITELDVALAEARALRVPHVEGLAEHARGLAMAALEDHDAAIAGQERAAAIGARIGARHLVVRAHAARILHALDRGRQRDLEWLRAEVEEVRAEAEPYGPLRSVAEALVARALLAAGHPRPALDAAERALGELRAQGSAGEFEEHARLAHVLTLLGAGRSDDADAALYQARERLVRKAAKLGPALRRTFLEGVLVHRRLMALATLRLGSKG